MSGRIVVSVKRVVCYFRCLEIVDLVDSVEVRYFCFGMFLERKISIHPSIRRLFCFLDKTNRKLRKNISLLGPQTALNYRGFGGLGYFRDRVQQLKSLPGRDCARKTTQRAAHCPGKKTGQGFRSRRGLPSRRFCKK